MTARDEDDDTLAALREALPLQAPPSGFADRVMAGLAEVKPAT